METPLPDVCPLCRFPIGTDKLCTNPACRMRLDKGDWGALPEVYGATGLLPPTGDGEPFRLAPATFPPTGVEQGKLLSRLPPALDPADGPCHIGGSADNNVRIAGASSPHQVSIFFNRRSRDWWAFDWGGGSDATLNGERFRTRRLKDDAILCIAGVALRYRTGRLSAEYGTADGVDLAVSGITDARMSHGESPHPLLDRVSFVVPDGEFVGIIGPSGCGKSTLIKTLAGLVKPVSGTVTFNGRTRESDSLGIRACTAYLPQTVDATLHNDLTLAEEISTYSAIHNAGRDEAREDALLKNLHLSDKVDVRVGDLSGGQRRRAAFLLAMLREPSVLLLDEPAAGLDRASETDLMEDLRQMTRPPVRRTILCATHELANINLFDRVLVLADGRLVYNGSPDDLFETLRISSKGNERFKMLYEDLANPSRNPAIAEGIRRNAAETPPHPATLDLPKPTSRASWFGCFLGYLGRFARTMSGFVRRSVPPAADGSFLQKAVRIWRLAAKWVFNAPLVCFVWQPLLVAFCLACALRDSYTDSPDEQKVVFFCAAIAAFWLGMAGSVRSLVSNRIGRSMEHLEGVSRTAHLAAVSVATLGKGLLQGGVLTFFLYVFPPLFGYEHPWAETTISVFGIGLCVVVVEWMGGFAGMALSAMCPTENMAVTMVPNLAVVALFFSQPLMEFDNDDKGAAARFARNLPAHDAHVAMTDWNNVGRPNEDATRDSDSCALAGTTISYLAILFLLSLGSQSLYERSWEG